MDAARRVLPRSHAAVHVDTWRDTSGDLTAGPSGVQRPEPGPDRTGAEWAEPGAERAEPGAELLMQRPGPPP